MNNYSFEKFVSSKEFDGGNTYVVKPGDTLYKIANMYGISVEDIILYNKMQTTTIYPNQIIFIPTCNKYYTKPGDTLSIISERNGISVDCLMKNNCVKDLYLKENQAIETSGKEIIITPGITVDDILKNYKIDSYNLLILNKDKWFKVNEKIIIK